MFCLGLHISNLCGNVKLISLFCVYLYSSIEITLFQFGQIGYHRAEVLKQSTRWQWVAALKPLSQWWPDRAWEKWELRCLSTAKKSCNYLSQLVQTLFLSAILWEKPEKHCYRVRNRFASLFTMSVDPYPFASYSSIWSRSLLFERYILLDLRIFKFVNDTIIPCFPKNKT